MSRNTNENEVKRKTFYPSYAKENLTIKTEGKRKQLWSENFIRENLLYYRKMMKYYIIFTSIFIVLVIIYYKLK